MALIGLRRRFLRPMIWFFTVVLVLQASLAWLVPVVVRKGIVVWLETHPDAVVKVQHIRFNPWVWSLRLQNLDIYLPKHPQRPVLNIRSLSMRMQVRSLLKHQFIFDEITLFEPHIWLIADQQGEWNFAELLQSDAKPVPASTENNPTPQWLIRSLRILELHIHVLDPRQDLSQPLLLVLHRSRFENIGTIGQHAGQVHIHLHGDMPGEKPWRLVWDGHLRLKPLGTSGHIVLSDLNLNDLAVPVRQRFSLDLVHGWLQKLTMDFKVQVSEAKVQTTVHNLNAWIEGVDVRALSMRKPPWLKLGRLEIRQLDADTATHALSIQEVALNEPQVLVHRTAQGQIDVVNVLKKLIPPPDPTAPSWDVALKQLQFNEGRVHFNDALEPENKELFLQHVDLKLENFSTSAPSELWPFRFSARGPLLGVLGIQGGINQQAGDLNWHADALYLPNFRPLLPRSAGVELQSGIIDAHGLFKGEWKRLDSLQSTVDAVLSKVQLSLASGVQAGWAKAEIQGQWREQQGMRLAGRWSNIHIQQGQQQWVQQHLEFKGLQLDAALKQLHLSTLEQDQMQWTGAWGTVVIPQVKIQGVQLPLSAKQAQIANVQIFGVHVNATQADRSLDSHIGSLSLNQVRWTQPTQQLQIAAVNTQELAATVQSSQHPVHWFCQDFGLKNLGIAIGSQTMQWDMAQMRGFLWQGAHHWLNLNLLQIPSVRVDMGSQQINTGLVQLQMHHLRLGLNQHNQLRMLQELGLGTSPSSSGTSVQQGAAPQGAGWVVRSAGVQASFDQLLLHDPALEKTPFVIKNLHFSLGALDTSQSAPIASQLAVQLEPAGDISWQGTIAVQPVRAQGVLSVQNLDLYWLEPYLEQDSRLRLDHGSLSTQGKLGYASVGLSYQGSLTLNDTQFDDSDQQPVLSWSSIVLPNMEVHAPGITHIAQVQINNMFSQVVIEPDKTLNWLNLIQPAPQKPPVPSVVEPSAAASAAVYQVAMDQVVLHQAGIDFTDKSLPTPFHVSIHDLDIQVNDLEQNHPEHWSVFSGTGVINQHGQVQMQGQVQPFVMPLALQADLHFKNIEVPTLNPYSMVFAGYQINQGMLNLDLHYALHNNRLEGKNHFVVDQLELGPRVSATDAEAWPLKLAIDMLRNRKGVIDLNVPIYGNLNDPSFDVRSVVVKAIEQSIRHIVESPISLIADLLGEDSDTVKTIGFVPGSSVLDADSLSRLKKISAILLDHEVLIVSVKAYYDTHSDAKALQQLIGSANTNLSADSLRELAIRRAEAVKKSLLDAGIKNHRIYIDEPGIAASSGPSTWVKTTIDIRHP